MRITAPITDAAALLAAHTEPLDQLFRKVGGTHAPLDDRNIVRHAPNLDDLVLQVGDGKCRARITVTRLSDRTGIQEIATREFHSECCKRFAEARSNLQDLEARAQIGKTALVMCVPEESHWGGGLQEAVQSLLGSEDVFSFILKGAVNKYNAVCREGSGRQGR